MQIASMGWANTKRKHGKNEKLAIIKVEDLYEVVGDDPSRSEVGIVKDATDENDFHVVITGLFGRDPDDPIFDEIADKVLPGEDFMYIRDFCDETCQEKHDW